MKFFHVAAFSMMAIAATVSGIWSAHADPTKPVFVATGPVLVELFTSQGCSSCPPADRLLEKLDSEGAVVAVSRPVTYWDRLGWKDTIGVQPRETVTVEPWFGPYSGRYVFHCHALEHADRAMMLQLEVEA